ncbi:MAG: hypothetical protein P8M03_05700 [Flavobacteriaceae bacterium]|nr:hypothetical protein [Flavobacteriaceae bacterium]
MKHFIFHFFILFQGIILINCKGFRALEIENKNVQMNGKKNNQIISSGDSVLINNKNQEIKYFGNNQIITKGHILDNDKMFLIKSKDKTIYYIDPDMIIFLNEKRLEDNFKINQINEKLIEEVQSYSKKEAKIKFDIESEKGIILIKMKK